MTDDSNPINEMPHVHVQLPDDATHFMLVLEIPKRDADIATWVLTMCHIAYTIESLKAQQYRLPSETALLQKYETWFQMLNTEDDWNAFNRKTASELNDQVIYDIVKTRRENIQKQKEMNERARFAERAAKAAQEN